MWKSIETAPKTGERILLYQENYSDDPEECISVHKWSHTRFEPRGSLFMNGLCLNIMTDMTDIMVLTILLIGCHYQKNQKINVYDS